MGWYQRRVHGGGRYEHCRPPRARERAREPHLASGERHEKTFPMVAEDVVDVVIAGAGPCGLLLANDLARRGASDLKLVVLDAAAGPSVHTKAMAVQLRTLEVFAKLKNLPGAPFPGMLVFPQFRNEDMLLDMLEEACGGRTIVQYSTKIVDYDETPEYIDVKVDGPEGERFIKTRFLVGAEGAHSVVRHRLGVPFPGGSSRRSSSCATARSK